MVSVDLQKAEDMAPCGELWRCVKKWTILSEFEARNSGKSEVDFGLQQCFVFNLLSPISIHRAC